MRAKLVSKLFLTLCFVFVANTASIAAQTPFNIEDQYLNQARKERVRVTIVMMSGEKLEGYIKSFDLNCILIESSGDILLYKHAVSSITSADGSFSLSADTPLQSLESSF